MGHAAYVRYRELNARHITRPPPSTHLPHVPEQRSAQRLCAVAKTIRGARQPDRSRTHLIAIVDHDTGAPLVQDLIPP